MLNGKQFEYTARRASYRNSNKCNELHLSERYLFQQCLHCSNGIALSPLLLALPPWTIQFFFIQRKFRSTHGQRYNLITVIWKMRKSFVIATDNATLYNALGPLVSHSRISDWLRHIFFMRYFRSFTRHFNLIYYDDSNK